jgi:hypothetical protein
MSSIGVFYRRDLPRTVRQPKSCPTFALQKSATQNGLLACSSAQVHETSSNGLTMALRPAARLCFAGFAGGTGKVGFGCIALVNEE